MSEYSVGDFVFYASNGQMDKIRVGRVVAAPNGTDEVRTDTDGVQTPLGKAEGLWVWDAAIRVYTRPQYTARELEVIEAFEAAAEYFDRDTEGLSADDFDDKDEFTDVVERREAQANLVRSIADTLRHLPDRARKEIVQDIAGS